LALALSVGETASSVLGGRSCRSRDRAGRSAAHNCRWLSSTLAEKRVAASLAVVCRVSAPASGRAAFRQAIGTNETDTRLTLAFSVGETTSSVLSCRACGSGDRSRRGGRSGGWGSRGRVTVPVGNWVAHALSDSDGSETIVIEVLEHVVGEGVGAELMDIVGNGKARLRFIFCLGSIDTALEVVFGILDLLLGELVVVIGIQVEGCDNIAESLQICLTRGSVTGRVRWAHVSRVLAENVTNSHLVLHHLVVTLLLCDFVEVLVRPSVTGNLVALRIHSLDDTTPVLVNGTFADIVTSYEEGSLCVVLVKLSQNIVSVDVWTVIISQSNSVLLHTRADTYTAVLDISKLRTGVVAGCGTVWCLQSIATRAEVNLAIRSLAVRLTNAAVTLSRATFASSTNGIVTLRTTAALLLADVKLRGFDMDGSMTMASEEISVLQVFWEAKHFRNHSIPMGSNHGCHQRGG